MGNMKLSFSQKLLIVFLLVVVSIILLAAITYRNNKTHQETTQLLDHARQMQDESENLSSFIKDQESRVKGFIMTGDTAFIEPFSANTQYIFNQLSELKNLAFEAPSQKLRLDSLESEVHQKFSFLQRWVELKKTEGFAGAQKLMNTERELKRMDTINRLISDLHKEENKVVQARKQANDESLRRFTIFYSILIALLLFTIITTFILLWHHLKLRLKTEKLLTDSKRLLQSIMDYSSALIFIKDLKGQYILVNRQFEEVYQVSREEILGKTDKEVFPEPFAGKYAAADQRVIAENKSFEGREDILQGDQLHPYYSVKFPLYKSNGELYGVGGISTNITDLLMEQQLERQKEIAELTIEAQEQERKIIGRELHDNINQLLTTSKILIDAALDMEGEMEKLCLEKSRDALNRAITEIRNLSHSLIPPSFDNDDFTNTIDEIASTLRLSNKMDVDLSISPRDQLNKMQNKTKLALYRIIQEQLLNVIKYARASMVGIDLRLVGRMVRLKISDNGVGFDPQKKAKGFGLKNIYSRAEVLNGKMKINSTPGQGSTMQVEIPV